MNSARICIVSVVCAWSSLALPAMPVVLSMPVVAQAAQQSAENDVVVVRVTSAALRLTAIDRGTADGLAKGDRVVLRPRGGGQQEGTIVRIAERSAVVELDDATFVPQPGTRGEVRVPRSRSALHAEDVAPPQAAEPPKPPAPAEAHALPEHPPWPNTDDDWNAKQPLLAQVRPLRPSERDPRISGFAYAGFDFLRGTEGPAQNVFARTGGSVLYENIAGGGDLHIDGEVNYRKTDVPDDDDEQFTRGILYRLSYSIGGNRFAPNRLEVGRFLQYGMPEFGVLDGVEWDRRLAGGNSFGASIGFLPVPDEHLSTGTDFGIAAWYRWVADESEIFSVTGGFEKTFHDFNADRDLFVAKAAYLPGEGWTLNGTVWVDFYGAGDTAKSSFAEVTQAYLMAGRIWESGSALRATYTHMAFPELDRNEFTPVTQAQLANDHTDRVLAYGRQALGKSLSLFGLAAAWKDEDESGGDGEAGIGIDDVLFRGSRFETSAFGSAGKFTNTIGFRASMSVLTPHANWRLGYEFTQNTIDGFQSNDDNLPQHAARASWETHTESGWSCNATLGLAIYDSETAVNVGVLLQRSF